MSDISGQLDYIARRIDRLVELAEERALGMAGQGHDDAGSCPEPALPIGEERPGYGGLGPVGQLEALESFGAGPQGRVVADLASRVEALERPTNLLPIDTDLVDLASRVEALEFRVGQNHEVLDIANGVAFERIAAVDAKVDRLATTVEKIVACLRASLTDQKRLSYADTVRDLLAHVDSEKADGM